MADRLKKAVATVVREIFDEQRPDGTVRHLEYEYDDSTLIVSLFRCTNTSPLPLPVTATHLASGRQRSRIFAATSGTTEFPIPTGAAQRLVHFVNPQNGRLDGIDWSIG